MLTCLSRENEILNRYRRNIMIVREIHLIHVIKNKEFFSSPKTINSDFIVFLSPVDVKLENNTVKSDCKDEFQKINLLRYNLQITNQICVSV